jgi:hypothetical protein
VLLPWHLSKFVSFFLLFVTLFVSLSPSRHPCPLYRCSNGHVSIVSTHGHGQSVWRKVNGCQDCGYGQHVCSFAPNILFGLRTAYLNITAEVLARPACCNVIRRASLTQITRLPRQGHFLLRRRSMLMV